jgi:hypothetical protein
MMLLDPYLYDFVAEHQRALREAAERARRPGARGPGWWRLPLGVPTVVESRTVPSVASRRLVCRRLLAYRHPSGHALVGHDG